MCFLAQLGAGQGTVDAPLNWKAVFDILLDALATVPSHYRFHDIDCLQHPTVDTAAADDLLSACGTLHALQRKADIVSAFCIIFGLDIATTKLRTFHLQWGNGNLDLAPSDDPAQQSFQDTLLVHTGRWIPQTVRLASTGVMKHLGVHWDMRYDGASIYQLILDNLEAAISVHHSVLPRDQAGGP